MKANINRRGDLSVSLSGQIEKGFARILEKAARAALNEAAVTTPQYSGDMASNWRISIDNPKPGKKSTLDPTRVREEGDLEAVSVATGSQKPRFLLGHKFYISTYGKHDEAYAGPVERDEIAFRNVNPSGGHILARAKFVLVSEVRRLKLLKEGK